MERIRAISSGDMVAICFLTSPKSDEQDLSFLNYKNAITLIGQDGIDYVINCPPEVSEIQIGEADDKELAVFDKFLQEQKKGNLDVHADANLNNLIEKVGQYAVEKKSVSVDEIGESLSADKESVKEALEKLAKIGVVEMPDEKGQYKVMMDRETFEDKIKRFRELSERMKLISASKNTNFSDITIAKSLIKEENDRAIKTRVPGTWGENARYIWLNKSDVMEIYGGKTLLSFIDREKTYKLYTDDNRVVETIKGYIIYKNHYDPVSKGVREHYEKVTTKQRTPQRKTR